MQLPNINMKAFLSALATSIVVFLAFYLLNKPPSTTMITTNATSIPDLEPTLQAAVPIITLDEDGYKQNFRTTIQTSTVAVASVLDIFDANPAVLMQLQTEQGKQLQVYLNQLSTNYYNAKNVEPPEKYAELHQDLLTTLAKLNDANITLLSSSDNANQEQAVTGYELLDAGSQELGQLALRLQ